MRRGCALPELTWLLDRPVKPEDDGAWALTAAVNEIGRGAGTCSTIAVTHLASVMPAKAGIQ
jgi:hypothetical protein